MKKQTNSFALFENGVIHTRDLSESDANEMLERYTRIFPELEFYVMNIENMFN